ncbi:MAG: MG2 domain-containing protein, partial [Bryobacteraceae bacterium]
MRRLRFLAIAVLLGASAQDVRRPYFSVSSNRAFAPGEKPVVNLWTQNVDALEFRVYKINDPVAFFARLEDPHRFGARPPVRPQREITGIERFHDFKSAARRRIANAFRAQYTPASRETIRNWMARRSQAPAGAKNFAALPLINSQQLVATWQQSIPKRERWEGQQVPVGVTGRGLYLVEAASAELRAFTIVAVSELSLVTKTAPGRVVAFAVNNRTSEPVADCPVIVLAGRTEAGRARTGADGVAEIRVPGGKGDSQTLVLARRGDDFASSGVYDWYLASDPDRMLVGYIHTDRPTYRPGHTLHWKAIVRRQSGLGYELPLRTEARVEILDPEGKKVHDKPATLTAKGTLSGDFTVPAAALGYYSIVLHLGSTEANGGFHVEEYRKPDYDVRIAPQRPRVTQGEPIQAVISARYFFGEPVARAKVAYAVHRARHWNWSDPDDAEDTPEETDEGYLGGYEQVSEESGELDADGRLAVSIPSASENPWDLRYRIEARVTDAAGREIRGASSLIATRGSFFLRLHPRRFLYSAGETATLAIEARDYDGRPVETAVRVDLKNGPVVDVRTDRNGTATAELAIPSAGSHVARAVARTPEGREVEDTTWIWAAGGGFDWYGGRRERLRIVSDKPSYKPGETARVMIVTGAPAHVLVSTEGRDLYSRQVVVAREGTATVEIPIRPEYAPNFYVSAAFIRDNHLFEGTRRIRVPASDKKLDVEIAASKPEYKPGETAVYTVTTRDASGKPAASELSLGVVDEAIYAIRPDPATDIFRFFYGLVSNRVGTNSSLHYYFHGEAGKRAMDLARLRPRAGMATLKPEQLVQPKVRKFFPDTAYWAAHVETGASGRAQVKFEFPDALTAWRTTARAVTT